VRAGSSCRCAHRHRRDAALRPFDPPESAPALRERALATGRTGRTALRDLAGGAVETRFDWIDSRSLIVPSATELAEHNAAHYRLVEGDPLSAQARCEVTVGLARGGWRTSVEVRAAMTCDAGAFRLETEVAAYEGATLFHTRRWSHAIARDGV
jgi:hypothetical protein